MDWDWPIRGQDFGKNQLDWNQPISVQYLRARLGWIEINQSERSILSFLKRIQILQSMLTTFCSLHRKYTQCCLSITSCVQALHLYRGTTPHLPVSATPQPKLKSVRASSVYLDVSPRRSIWFLPTTTHLRDEPTSDQRNGLYHLASKGHEAWAAANWPPV